MATELVLPSGQFDVSVSQLEVGRTGPGAADQCPVSRASLGLLVSLFGTFLVIRACDCGICCWLPMVRILRSSHS